MTEGSVTVTEKTSTSVLRSMMPVANATPVTGVRGKAVAKVLP
jgi:hypothetical protein